MYNSFDILQKSCHMVKFFYVYSTGILQLEQMRKLEEQERLRREAEEAEAARRAEEEGTSIVHIVASCNISVAINTIKVVFLLLVENYFPVTRYI